MTFKIYYMGDCPDDFTVSGETIEEVREATLSECERRGWDASLCWSEEV